MGEQDFTVLVVDDEESNRDLLKRRLERRGYHVTLAGGGQAALDAVEHGGIDLVLLDVMMPGLDGLAVLAHLRRSHTPLELPIIMVTAKSDSKDVVGALDAGANDYVTKPIDFAVLVARLEVHLRNRETLRTARPPTPRTAAPQKIAPGVVLAEKYEILSRIGGGNFGTVYRARHIDLDMPVAVKVLQHCIDATPDGRTRFQREGISACRIRHPNAVQVTDFGVTGKFVFLVMELLSGRSLEEELVLSGRLSVARSVEIALPVCSVLAESHRTGIIHRDIKPANVFLHQSPQGEIVKVLDFGIAKLVDDPRLTTKHVILGTPAYMAPERFRGAPCEGASDVYSVGTMLYQMLAGRLPFVPAKAGLMPLANMKLTEAPQPLRQVNPEVPQAIEDVVMATLQREPAARPTAETLADGLAHAVGIAVAEASAGARPPAHEGAESEPHYPTEVLPALEPGTASQTEPPPDEDAPGHEPE